MSDWSQPVYVNRERPDGVRDTDEKMIKRLASNEWQPLNANNEPSWNLVAGWVIWRPCESYRLHGMRRTENPLKTISTRAIIVTCMMDHGEKPMRKVFAEGNMRSGKIVAIRNGWHIKGDTIICPSCMNMIHETPELADMLGIVK